MKTSVIINPASGPVRLRQTPEALVTWARTWLAAHELDSSIDVIAGPGDGARLGRQALNRGAELVIAWGGDGTVNAVASALVGGSASLGIIPAGSGNGLALELGIPGRREEAWQTAFSGRDRAIDAGELNGQLFFNVAGIGFDAHVAHVFAHSAGHARGFLAYFATTVLELFKYVPSRYVVSAGAGAVSRDAPALFISIANTRQWGNGAHIAPQAQPDDGRLDFVLIDARHPAVILAQLYRLYAKSVAKIGGTVMAQVQDVSIQAIPAAPVHLDGEPLGELKDICIRVRPAALRVRVPVNR